MVFKNAHSSLHNIVIVNKKSRSLAGFLLSHKIINDGDDVRLLTDL